MKRDVRHTAFDLKNCLMLCMDAMWLLLGLVTTVDRFRVQGLELVEAGAPHLPNSISFVQAKLLVHLA